MDFFSRDSKKNNRLFIGGILFLVISLALLLFSLYMMPYLLLGFNYQIPGVITDIIILLQYNYGVAAVNSKILTWFIFFVPGVISGYISYRISYVLDRNKLM